MPGASVESSAVRAGDALNAFLANFSRTLRSIFFALSAAKKVPQTRLTYERNSAELRVAQCQFARHTQYSLYWLKPVHSKFRLRVDVIWAQVGVVHSTFH